MVEQFKYGNITDTGSASTVNEDYYGCFDTPNGKLFVLCDGMSNPIGGHVASKVAVDAIREYYNLKVFNNLIISLQNAFTHANNAVLGKIQTEPELAGMATTCLIVIIKDNRVFHANVGSSRLYHFRSGKCMLISGGHCTVNSLSSSESVLKIPADVISEYSEEGILGSSLMKQPNICNEPLIPASGDFLLLCSAGFTHILAENFSAPIIYNNQELQMRVADLVKLADKNQTADNITLQLIEFNPDKTKNNPIHFNNSETVIRKRIDNKSDRSPVVLPVILILLIAAVIYFGSRYFKTEKSAVTVSNETITDSAVVKQNEIPSDKPGDNSLSTTAQFEPETDTAKYTPRGFHPQLPPVNSGISFESESPQNIETVQPSARQIFSGSGDAYVYTLQEGDNASALKNKFGKSWEQFKNEDPNYSEAMPQPGKDIKVYGYIFFASGSERERNENIENALKSSPGLKRSQIIIVPDGILIP